MAFSFSVMRELYAKIRKFLKFATEPRKSKRQMDRKRVIKRLAALLGWMQWRSPQVMNPRVMFD